jgi:hypothetical protein
MQSHVAPPSFYNKFEVDLVPQLFKLAVSNFVALFPVFKTWEPGMQRKDGTATMAI